MNGAPGKIEEVGAVIDHLPEKLTNQKEPESCPACPACGGRLLEIRGHLECSRCRMICEGCCEGGRT